MTVVRLCVLIGVPTCAVLVSILIDFVLYNRLNARFDRIEALFDGVDDRFDRLLGIS